jgi:uncharacterized membrane protein
MKKPGSYLGLSLAAGVIISMIITKEVGNGFAVAMAVIGVSLLTGLFLEYYKYMRKK